MALRLRAPDWRRDYVAAQGFRFCQRPYEAGAVVNPRRLDMSRGRLDQLFRDGVLRLPDEDEDRAYRESEASRIEGWQPPQPTAPPEQDEEPSREERAKARKNEARRRRRAAKKSAEKE